MKIYNDGIALRNSKKVEDWTSADFHAMIKFKQLGKDGMPPLPTNLGTRRLRWSQVCLQMVDPPEPTKPDGYIDDAIPSSTGSDDERSVASIQMFEQV